MNIVKKNGFTFIEVLGVITLLVIISVIILVVVDKSLKDSKEVLTEIQVENIKSAAKMWMTDNIELIPDDGYYTINLETLENSGYVSDEMRNFLDDDINKTDFLVQISMNDILIGEETGYDSMDNFIYASALSQIELLKNHINLTTVNGIYYYNDFGNLELDIFNSVVLDNKGNIPKGSVLVHNGIVDYACLNYETYFFQYDGKSLKKIDTSCSINKGDNLVINGYLEYENNINFSKFTYNDESLNYTSSAKSTVFSNYYIPVDVNKSYEMGATVKSTSATTSNYFGFASYDIDNNMISPSYYQYVSGTLTELVQDLNNGDEYIYLKDVSNWNISQSENKYNKGFIFWNYVDSTGYQYPELTYSRNVYSNLYEFSNIDFNNNRIKLNSPWSNGHIKAGIKLSQGDTGGTYNYTLYSTKKLTNNWQDFNGIIDGIIDDGNVNNNKFRPGTRYVRLLILDNYSDESNVTTSFKDIYFREVVE